MVDDGPAASIRDAADDDRTGVGYTALSHPEMLGSVGLSASLFSNWSRQKRRIALSQRYGEDFVADSMPDVSLWQDTV